MSTLIDGLPALDCHAHIAPDVTAAQLQALGSAHIFAVTRSLDEAEQAVSRRDARVTWGLGLHPAVAAARAAWDPDQFARLLPSFALVGEVGLDKRAGHLPVQQGLFRDVLGLCSHEAVLISVHSSGATAAVTKMLAEQPHPGVILHWFLGSHEEIRTAVESGAYFSVNSGMTHAASAALPSDRVLTETDFPARQPKAKRPADTTLVEQTLADIWSVTPEEARVRCWRNLRALATQAQALDRLPDALADLLLDL
ncbi:MAG: TatD family deoxyribonuclease [Pseudonocardiales bacterium]|nr:MAG: TatD family deoxyribonuclease [Pseudonocardiales bacterium]